MANYTQSQNKATQKYIKSHYDNIVIRVPKGDRDIYKELAARRGASLNQFIIDLLKRELEN